jgi:hypothetical protein
VVINPEIPLHLKCQPPGFECEIDGHQIFLNFGRDKYELDAYGYATMGSLALAAGKGGGGAFASAVDDPPVDPGDDDDDVVDPYYFATAWKDVPLSEWVYSHPNAIVYNDNPGIYGGLQGPLPYGSGYGYISTVAGRVGPDFGGLGADDDDDNGVQDAITSARVDAEGDGIVANGSIVMAISYDQWDKQKAGGIMRSDDDDSLNRELFAYTGGAVGAFQVGSGTVWSNDTTIENVYAGASAGERYPGPLPGQPIFGDPSIVAQSFLNGNAYAVKPEGVEMAGASITGVTNLNVQFTPPPMPNLVVDNDSFSFGGTVGVGWDINGANWNVVIGDPTFID